MILKANKLQFVMNAVKSKPATRAGVEIGSGRQNSVKRVILLYSRKLRLRAVLFTS